MSIHLLQSWVNMHLRKHPDRYPITRYSKPGSSAVKDTVREGSGQDIDASAIEAKQEDDGASDFGDEEPR